MRLYFQLLILTILAMLIFQQEVLKQRIDAAYEKAEDAAFISAMILNAQPSEPEMPPFMHKRYTIPEQDLEHPWMLEEPPPTEFPPPTES